MLKSSAFLQLTDNTATILDFDIIYCFMCLLLVRGSSVSGAILYCTQPRWSLVVLVGTNDLRYCLLPILSRSRTTRGRSTQHAGGVRYMSSSLCFGPSRQPPATNQQLFSLVYFHPITTNSTVYCTVVLSKVLLSKADTLAEKTGEEEEEECPYFFPTRRPRS